MNEGLIFVIPISILSLCILFVWFVKGAGSKQWKLKFLLAYVLISSVPLVFNATFLSALLLFFGGYVVPILSSRWLNHKAI